MLILQVQLKLERILLKVTGPSILIFATTLHEMKSRIAGSGLLTFVLRIDNLADTLTKSLPKPAPRTICQEAQAQGLT
jgi:hypothetical protein